MNKRSLIICEKPIAARRIAEALDEDNNPIIITDLGAPYYKVKKNGEELLIVSALGHLYSLVQSRGKWTYPIYEYKWVPKYEVTRKAYRTKTLIKIINELEKDVDEYVSACDYDLEGSLIAYNIIRYACGPESLSMTRRMLFNNLTNEEINNSWEKRTNALDFQVIAAGKARHELDWLLGINLTRALTLSVKNATGYYKTLSIGRVQGPTLDHIKKREEEIEKFKPTMFWVINSHTLINSEKYVLEYNKPRIPSEKEARNIVSKCYEKEGTINHIELKTVEKHPPSPFNIGDLQIEAYKLYKLSPSTTLQIAEKLYLGAYVSYPRTESQRLPPTINLKQILRKLETNNHFKKSARLLLSQRTLKPHNGRKNDPAHPAIHPTGKLPYNLAKNDYKIYSLICRRFMACLGLSAFQKIQNAEISVEGFVFHLKNQMITEEGWMAIYYPNKQTREKPIPSLLKGMKIPIINVDYQGQKTKPPKRYNPATLIRLMEGRNLGTKATRAPIIDTLYKRGYITGQTIKITKLGAVITDILRAYCPGIISIEMTRELEKKLDDIQEKQLEAKELLKEVVNKLDPILLSIKNNEEEIGRKINKVLRDEINKRITLGTCPECGEGEIIVITSKKSGKRFAGCTNYTLGCKQSYPLPQKGRIKPSRKKCLECGAPLTELRTRRKKPWIFCLNPNCSTKKKTITDNRREPYEFQTVPNSSIKSKA